VNRKASTWGLVLGVVLMTVHATSSEAQDVAGRRLVLCLDGTWNSTANEHERETGDKVLRPTNALKVCRAVKPFADKQQITYYDIGVGSLARYSGTANRLLYRADKFLGGAWGAGFEGNVEDALHFIVLNYQPNDEVYIFGFSRGAATARAVTRFLEWSGGIPSKNDAYYMPFFFRHYVESHGDANAFRSLLDETNRRRAQHEDEDNRYPIVFHPVNVRYLGVWDTVAALGSRFASRGKETSAAGRTFHAGKAPASCVRHARQALAIDEKRFDFRPEIWTEGPAGDQVMAQRWFTGVHSNIGGGLATDGLANIALHWIVQGAKSEQLVFDNKFLGHFPPIPTAKVYESWTAMYKALDLVRFRYGKGKRVIGGAKADIDPSVFKRMNADAKYRPENVLQYLACQPDLAPFGSLPADVAEKVEKLRPKCGAVQSTSLEPR
jgi:uncharacterized protein (DUF2235 family)